MNLLLDTNIIIDWYTHGPSVAYLENKINEEGTELSTSIICAIEFLIKAKKREQQSFYTLVNNFELILYSFSGFDSASLIANICRDQGLKIPDAVIIYTAIENNCCLVTRDKELYQKGRHICNIEYILS